MKSKSRSCFETVLPYWAENAEDVPVGLRMLISNYGVNLSAPWLILPYEGVGSEPYQEFAMRRCDDGLEILMAVPRNGFHRMEISAKNCQSVQFAGVLLYSEVTFVLKNGTKFSVYFNAVGDSKFQYILEPLMNALTAPARQELLRLTGVDLVEEEAAMAMAQIHSYKWLEAERAGFDTWAVIQPENPLRAAAVHWTRKYFSQFERAIRNESINSGVA